VPAAGRRPPAATVSVRFRNEIVTGVGGKQILLEDPVELFEPIVPEARLSPSLYKR
jgi:hypothetical protein